MTRHVIIIGDSISIAYTPLVQARLADRNIAIAGRGTLRSMDGSDALKAGPSGINDKSG